MTADPAAAIALAEELRGNGIRVQIYGEQKKFKQKMTYADRIGVPYAIFLGDDEIAQGKCSVKDMRSGEQKLLTSAEAAALIKTGISAGGAIILEK